MEKVGVVSVIVPIYNVEPYLRRCIDSLLGQTYPYLEVILVDDGSPDGCGVICDEYAIKDSRIRVIHKVNAGLGMARNSGLEIATGDFVVFVDSDDYVKENYVEVLLHNLVEAGADFASAGFFRHFSNGQVHPKSITQERKVWNKADIVEKVLLPIIGPAPEYPEEVEREMSVWLNIYRRDLIEKQNLRFVSEREFVSEDCFFNLLYILNAEKAVFCPECLYIYSENPTSLTATYRADRYEKYCKMFWKEQEILKEYGVADAAKLRLYRTFIMKAGKCISMLAESKTSAKEKRNIASALLEDTLLQEIVAEYKLHAVGIKQKIRVYMMKNKMTVALLAFYSMKTLKKRIALLCKRFAAFGKAK